MESRISLRDLFEGPIEDELPISKISPRSSRPRTASFSLTRPRSSSTHATGKPFRPSSSTSSNSTASTVLTSFVPHRTWEQLIFLIEGWSNAGSITKEYFSLVMSLLAGLESKRKMSTTFTIALTTSQFPTSSLELCGYTNGKEDFTTLITISDSNDLK